VRSSAARATDETSAASAPFAESVPNLSAIQSSKRTLGFGAEQRVHADIIHATAGHEMNKVDALLTQIAQRILRIETLESRRRDSLDFHDVSVWELRDALEAAYNAGIEQGRKTKGAGKSAS
jgi:hypothetical protein